MDISESKGTAEIWEKESSSGNAPGWIHGLIFLGLVILGIALGSLSSLSFQIQDAVDPARPAYGVNYFWLGIVVQQVGSIWYGAWGVLAGIVFPVISNTVTQASLLTSAAYLPANFVQSFLPAYLFRRLKLNPKLDTGRDYLYLFLSMLASSFFGALWSVLVLVLLGRLEMTEALTNFFGWFGGNLGAGIFFNFLLLKTLSERIIRSRGFVRGWWA